jgi:SNF2 family DNA or RNA helicase
LFDRDKVSNHLALIQARQTPGSNEEGSPEHIAFMKGLEFAKVALPPDVVKHLPGGSHIRRDGIMDKHFGLSGKLEVLDKLLGRFQKENARVLLFSYSTQTLDLIQNYVRSEGHCFLRMDGKTAHSKRQEIADKFNTDPSIFLLLLSTKAMGLGLNLTVSLRHNLPVVTRYDSDAYFFYFVQYRQPTRSLFVSHCTTI